MILGMPDTAYLLDDDEFDADLSLRAARRSHPELKLRWFSDYNELEEVLEELKEESLVIMDFKMPGIKADALLERWSSKFGNFKHRFVLFTSSDLQSDRDKCLAAGALAYYVKPMKLKEFRVQVEAIIKEWLPES